MKQASFKIKLLFSLLVVCIGVDAFFFLVALIRIIALMSEPYRMLAGSLGIGLISAGACLWIIEHYDA